MVIFHSFLYVCQRVKPLGFGPQCLLRAQDISGRALHLAQPRREIRETSSSFWNLRNLHETIKLPAENGDYMVTKYGDLVVIIWWLYGEPKGSNKCETILNIFKHNVWNHVKSLHRRADLNSHFSLGTTSQLFSPLQITCQDHCSIPHTASSHTKLPLSGTILRNSDTSTCYLAKQVVRVMVIKSMPRICSIR